MASGLVAVATTVAIGVVLHRYPGPNAVDRLGFSLLPASPNSGFFHVVTWLGSVTALVIGSFGAALLAWFTGPRDRGRVLACLVGPAAATMANQLLLKPIVARLYVGEISFTSGSVTVIAAIGAVCVLAIPRRMRPTATVLAIAAVSVMVVAVVALQWHYPTDALAGALFGVGTVLLIDGVIGIATGRGNGRSRHGGPQAAGQASHSARAHYKVEPPVENSTVR
jgi:membrane-associated phospholipid phosphatase